MTMDLKDHLDKKQTEAEREEEQAKIQAYLAELAEVSKKHGLELFPQAQFGIRKV